MDNSEVDAGRSEAGSDSSSGAGDLCGAGPSRKAGGEKNWNAAVLVFVILLTGVVAGHSLLAINRCRSRGRGCAGGSVSGWVSPGGCADAGCSVEAACPKAEGVRPQHKGCPLVADANEGCGSKADAPTSGCCPGVGFGRGHK
ncbi:MAG: hypothetical protein ACYS4W_09365 [Planctomycetota bacterium]|jgi:hypothetical protein